MSFKAAPAPQTGGEQVARAYPGSQGHSWLCWKSWVTGGITGGTRGFPPMAGDHKGLGRERGCHERTWVGSSWGGCGSVSRHWDRLWGRLRDGVLGAQEAEPQQRLRRWPLVPKQLFFPSIFFSATCIQTRVQRGGTVTLGYLNLKNPDFEDTCLWRWWWSLMFYVHCL